MPKVKVGDIQIYYQEIGSGEPLVMIMGLGADHTAWAFQVPALSQEYRCILFDNRGAGQSDQPDGPYTIAQLAGDTIGLMDALKIDQAHLLGLSMGGMISQEIAINNPERVRSLQLHSTTAKTDPYLYSVVEALVRAKTRLSREEFTRAFLVWLLTPRTFNEQPEFIETLVTSTALSPYPTSIHGFTHQAEACSAHDALDRLDKISCPTLITVGAEDILVPLRFSRVLHERIAGSELRVIPGGGHGALWEQPQAFNDACLDFLRRTTS